MNAAAPKTSTRIYRVREMAVNKVTQQAETIATRLVDASNPARALKHVVTPRFVVDVAEMNDVVALVKSGTEVENATTEE